MSERLLKSLIVVRYRILYRTDPETFGSLVLVNSAWRSASQTPHLYAHHLSRCPSFSISNNVIAGPFTEESLSHLKRRFAQEVKRNLFVAYLRPKRTTISFISSTTSSSAAFPGGEAFDFVFSSNGRWALALSSSRIFVIDTASPDVSVRRELKVLRRPLSAAILDNGFLLAVLSNDHRVNMYNLAGQQVEHIRGVSLDHPTHAITLSSYGEVLATAHDGGIEVHSLASSALATDQRGVKCDRVDSLSFSSDGTMLLGTTYNSRRANTVILSAPFYTEGDQDLTHSDMISSMWTSQILFPNSSRDCSHATLLPHHQEGDASWTFTYDRVFESFRAVRTDDLRNGTTYFTGPNVKKSSRHRRSKSRLMPCTTPAANNNGELVAAGFLGTEVWIYGVPEDLDTMNLSHIDDQTALGVSNRASSSTPPLEGSISSSTNRNASTPLSGLPQWQVLADKHRNVFAKGRRVAQLSGVSGMCWVTPKYEGKGSRSVVERLVVAAPGGVSGDSDWDEEQLPSVDGGRLVVLDFGSGVGDGRSEEVTIQVGDIDPELLQEQNMDMATEIAIVRRRTVANRREGLPRVSVADVLGPVPGSSDDVPIVPPIPDATSTGFGIDATVTEGSLVAGYTAPMASPTEGLSLGEVSEALDGPYSHTQPRSRNSLYRSATAVAANRRHNPPRIPDSGRIEYRRADGRGEVPHESDADNWVPPPPPYSPDADVPLPEHLRQALLPRRTVQSRQPSIIPRRPVRAQTSREGPIQRAFSERINSSDVEQMLQRPLQHQARRQTTGPAALSSTQEDHDVSSDSFSNDISRWPLPRRFSDNPQAARPMTAMERPTYMHGQTAGLAAPISPIQESVRSLAGSGGQSISLPSSPTSVRFPTSQLTLSGSNLQQRLDYPLPPPPQEPQSPSEPILPAGHQERASAPVLPPIRTKQPEESAYVASQRLIREQNPSLPSLPSPQQLANLQNRYSQTQNRRNSRSAAPHTSYSQNFPIPGPPRAALGATGSPISSSPHTEAPARSISRNRSNSRESVRSFSSSTPNLLRPKPRRLDTIHSVTSIMSISRTRSRDAGGSRPASTVRSRSVGPAPLPEEDGASTPTRKLWMGSRRGRRVQSEQVHGFGNHAAGEWEEGRKKKGGRCLVM